MAQHDREIKTISQKTVSRTVSRDFVTTSVDELPKISVPDDEVVGINSNNTAGGSVMMDRREAFRNLLPFAGRAVGGVWEDFKRSRFARRKAPSSK